MIFRIIDGYKTIETDGYRQKTPVVHVIGRDQSWERHHVPIDNFRPYFLVRQSEWIHKGEEIGADDRVLDVTTEDMRGRPETAIDGEQLYRVICRDPDSVRDLRELIDDPFEADVKYPVRFFVDLTTSVEVVSDSSHSSNGDDFTTSDSDEQGSSFQWVEIDDEALVTDSQGEYETVSAEYVTVGLDEATIPSRTPPPRVCSYDIEVQQGGGGPPVVSTEGTEEARNPITAITAHDSYTDEYRVWMMAHSSWGVDDSQAAQNAVDCDVSVYSNPRDVASFFCQYVAENDFDILSGWNANSFDHPYLVNYCLSNNVNSVYDLSPTRDVYDMNGDGNWINSSLKGRLLVDLLAMYKKTEIHELSSYRLGDVAQEEKVGVGKLSIEDEIDVPEGEPAIDYAWEHHPDVFAEYSVRDVKAVVGINRESKKNVNIL